MAIGVLTELARAGMLFAIDAAGEIVLWSDRCPLRFRPERISGSLLICAGIALAVFGSGPP